MEVLSLFDGISCGRLALEMADINVTKYSSSEVDKNSIKVAQANWPENILLGDVRELSSKGLENTDLLIGGSPCQSISNLGDRSGLAGKSGLFNEYLRLKKEIQPRYFLLENVVGNKNAIDEISLQLGCKPREINSNLFLPHNRKRLYWTNIEVGELPPLTELTLKDLLEPGVPDKSLVSEARLRWLSGPSGLNCLQRKYASIDALRASCLTARAEASWNSNYVTRDERITRLTPTEYERLQGLPDGYTQSVRDSARYKAIGDGWTVNVIAHILKNIGK